MDEHLKIGLKFSVLA